MLNSFNNIIIWEATALLAIIDLCGANVEQME